MQLSLQRAEVELALRHGESARDLAGDVLALVTASPQRTYLKLTEARATLDLGKALHLLGAHALAEPVLRSAVQLYASLYDVAASPTFADALVALSDCLVDLHRIDEARSLADRVSSIQVANTRLGPRYREPIEKLRAHLKAATHASVAVTDKP